ncbi:MAG: BlaI/MecI/CopY family transcriptional regulator [Bryobacteraceae bacterium]|nr:BlaI/MecI/CopY family transcriptional regulator [Bryobacteraceae bacterium]
MASVREMPPPLELECLKVLWTLGEGNVHEVRRVLADRRELAYTTVMTLLDRLVRKGGVSRRKVGRSFVYAPVLERDLLRRMAVRQLVDCFFEGSEAALAAYLTGAVVEEREPKEALAAAGTESRLDTALL